MAAHTVRAPRVYPQAFRLSDEERRCLRLDAAARGMTVSAVIRDALEPVFRRHRRRTLADR